MVKLKELIKEFASIGGVVTQKPIGNGISLSRIMRNEEMEEETPRVSAKELSERLGTFARYRSAIFSENNMRQVAKSLSELATYAREYALNETDESFDKVTISRNMKELAGFSKQYSKIAHEAQGLNERMGVLYEDMGNILNRYYDLGEALDKVDPSKVEPEDDYEDRDDKDIDNDGDSDSSDKYLHKKRKAITKAMGETYQDKKNRPVKRFKDIGN
jgi:hypothetical protein